MNSPDISDFYKKKKDTSCEIELFFAIFSRTLFMRLEKQNKTGMYNCKYTQIYTWYVNYEFDRLNGGDTQLCKLRDTI